MRVLSNLFGDGSKIKASEIIVGDSSNNKLLPEVLSDFYNYVNPSLSGIALLTNRSTIENGTSWVEPSCTEKPSADAYGWIVKLSPDLILFMDTTGGGKVYTTVNVGGAYTWTAII